MRFSFPAETYVSIKTLNILLTVVHYRRYKQWLVTEYAPARQDHKEIPIPAWFWPESLSRSSGRLLVRLLHYDPHMRLTAEEVLAQEWCRGEDRDSSNIGSSINGGSSGSSGNVDDNFGSVYGSSINGGRVLFPDELNAEESVTNTPIINVHRSTSRGTHTTPSVKHHSTVSPSGTNSMGGRNKRSVHKSKVITMESNNIILPDIQAVGVNNAMGASMTEGVDEL